MGMVQWSMRVYGAEHGQCCLPVHLQLFPVQASTSFTSYDPTLLLDPQTPNPTTREVMGSWLQAPPKNLQKHHQAGAIAAMYLVSVSRESSVPGGAFAPTKVVG